MVQCKGKRNIAHSPWSIVVEGDKFVRKESCQPGARKLLVTDEALSRTSLLAMFRTRITVMSSVVFYKYGPFVIKNRVD